MRKPYILPFVSALCLLPISGLFAQEEPLELEWPRTYSWSDGAKLVLYQPQITAWEEYAKIESRLALAFHSPGEGNPALGTYRLTADSDTNLETRLVRLTNLQVSEGKFPQIPRGDVERVRRRVLEIVPTNAVVVSLDRIIANLERSQSALQEGRILPDPPKILVSSKSAILVIFDGKPIWAKVPENELQFGVNTNWDIFFRKKDGSYYLLNGDYWIKSPSLAGPWSAVGKLPKPFKKLPKNDDNWKEVRSQIPGSKVRSEKVPIVYVSEVPAELILTDGMASLEMVPGTRLLWVTNTESDLFLSNEDSRFYYLVSGRWFRSESLEGPWKFATPELPEDFKRIPRNHARSHVRASIPGTEETQEAVILGQIPQKATVERGELNVAVDYQGEPQFHAIEGTSLYYAVNTQNDVIRVGDMYYVCYQAVWFVSASAQGPWEIAENVPDEIYTIPPSSPVYNTTYVRVYDYTPTSVTFGYTSGYWGMYYGWGTMAYGTGWYYPPYYYYDPFYPYPYYYSYPVSYGCSAWYNPNTGTYGRGASVYGPYGGMGRAAAYNPQTGTYARGAVAYGPYQARGWAEAYNPRTDTYARTLQGANVYGNWGTTAVRRGDEWARTGHYSGDGGTAFGYKTSRGSQGFVGRDENNLYAGRDGNVYRRNEEGWQKYDEGGNWNPVEDAPSREELRKGLESKAAERGYSRSDLEARAGDLRERGSGSASDRNQRRQYDRSTLDQLNRDSMSRNRGSQRVDGYRDWQGSSRSQSLDRYRNYRSSGGMSSSRSFGSGGMGGRVGSFRR